MRDRRGENNFQKFLWYRKFMIHEVNLWLPRRRIFRSKSFLNYKRGEKFAGECSSWFQSIFSSSEKLYEVKITWKTSKEIENSLEKYQMLYWIKEAFEIVECFFRKLLKTKKKLWKIFKSFRLFESKIIESFQRKNKAFHVSKAFMKILEL